MLGVGFDLVLGGIFIVLTFRFMIGKGEGILQAFSGKNYKKRDKKAQRKLEKSCAVFCAILAVAELAMAFLQNVWYPIGYVYIILIIADLIGFSVFYKKNFE